MHEVISRTINRSKSFSVIAMIQHITYEEHLPTLLGPLGHDMVINAPEEEPEVGFRFFYRELFLFW